MLYIELLDLAEGKNGGDILMKRVKVACVVACDVIRLEVAGTTNHANRLKWAKETLLDPDAMARRMLWAGLAQNKGAANPAAVTGIDDPTLQTAINNAVDLLAQG